jgi:hypothetical protein
MFVAFFDKVDDQEYPEDQGNCEISNEPTGKLSAAALIERDLAC